MLAYANTHYKKYGGGWHWVLRKAEKLYSQIIEVAPDTFYAISAMTGLAVCNRWHNKDVALEIARDATNKLMSLSNYEKHPLYSLLYILNDRLTDSKLTQRDVDIAVARYENDPRVLNLISCCSSIAYELLDAERFDEAISIYSQIVDLYREVDEIDHNDVLGIYESLSECYEKKGDELRALDYKEKSRPSTYKKIKTMIEDLSIRGNNITDYEDFLTTELMRVLFENGQYSLGEIESFEQHFIGLVESQINMLETKTFEPRNFESCYQILKNVLSGKNSFMQYMSKMYETHAMYNEALCYRDGENGKAQDVQKSFDLLIKADSLGDNDATTELGVIYLADPVEQSIVDDIPNYSAIILPNESLGMKYLRKSANNGDLRAMFVIGLHYMYKKKQYSEAETWLIRAAEKEYAEAQFALGRLYTDTEQKRFFNYEEAQKWYSKAAKSENERIAKMAGQALEDMPHRFFIYNLNRHMSSTEADIEE
ncbi:hypothetical protein FACS189490_05090 [Clostridia bacterium]|nr:hypothetical protein FACS189490_05090 [Clostridia bacterium]